MKKLLLACALLMCMSSPAFAADEVHISERGDLLFVSSGSVQPINGDRLTTQSLTLGATSAAFGTGTKYILICNYAGADIWYKIGASNVSSAANTAGNERLADKACREEPVSAGQYIDSAADS